MATHKDSTIANGAALGSGISIGRERPVGFYMPESWTPATLGIDVTKDGGITWFPVCDGITDYAGTEVAHTVVAAKYYGMNPALYAGATHIRPRSGSSGSHVNQGAERVITFVTLPFE